MTDTPTWNQAATGGIDADALKAFLVAAGMSGTTVAVYDGPDIPPSDPGSMIVATWLAGAGFSLEQMLDTPAVQLRFIGPQGNHAEARILARNADRALTALGAWPATLGGRYVVEVRRAGGQPSLDRVDDADRAHYVCTYLADVEAD